MGPIGRAQITFSHAAHAAGITEKQLRNWLDKAQVVLEGDDDREGGQWRRFALIDVVRLAVVGALVRYGIQVSLAAELIENVDSNLRNIARYQNAPRRAVYAACNGVTIIISHGGASQDGDTGYQVTDAERPVGPLRCRYTYGPADKPDTSDLRHYVMIDVGEIANDVLARLDQDDDDQEQPKET